MNISMKSELKEGC